MQTIQPPWLWRYGVAVLAVAIALLVKLLLAPLIQEESPFLLFFATVMVSAWYGGLGPGLFATALAAIVSDYFFLEPIYSLVLASFGKALRLLLFVLEGFSITFLSTALKAARQRAERNACQLQESEERFRLLIEGVKDYAIFALDPNGHIVSWNAGAERIKGYQAKEILGQHFSRFYQRKDIEQGKPDRELQIAAAVGRIEDEGWRLRKDGSRFWANVVITALRDETGKLRGFSKVTRDITQRKRVEEALRRSAQRLEALHEIDLAILAAQSPAEIAHAALARMRQLIPYQQAFVLLFNFEHGEAQVLAENVDNDLEPTQGVVLPLKDVFSNEVLQQQGQTRYIEDIAALADRPSLLERRLSEGMHSFIALSLLPEKDLIGELNLFSRQPAAFNSDYRDIAREAADQLAIAIQQARLREQLQLYAAELEQRINERTAALQEANTELEAFAYSVSHDLRAPLRAMQGFAQALLEDYADQLDSLAQDYAHRIVTAASRMDTLINDLLAYSRLSRGEIQLQQVSLAAVVTEALAQLEVELGEQQFQVKVEEPLPDVVGHRTTLSQVVLNLLTNAVKFVTPGVQPQVRIWAEELIRVKEAEGEASPCSSSRVRLWVEDNGIGIANQHQQRIFRVFERLHGIESYPGTGIGLAIVRKGVERMGGQVGVESQVGQGSRFWVELLQVENYE